MTTALVTFDTTRAGLTITTAGADQDQAIIAPHLDTAFTAWASVFCGVLKTIQSGNARYQRMRLITKKYGLV